MDKMLSKFRGAFLGGLVGDCLGAPYEVYWREVKLQTLIKMDEEIKAFQPNPDKSWMLHYTDDTEMAHVMAQSLISENKFSPRKIAKQFSKAYFNSVSERFYGGSVPAVFHQLKESNYSGDPYSPAAAQFAGQGSYGNGSGMRVFPIALFCFQDMEKLKELAACSARLTHSHQDAVNGAILQAAAVYFALESNSATTWQEIWGKLKNVCKEIEPETSNREKPYTDRLTRMYLFLTSTGSISNNEVVSKIGVDIQATEAISAAIFAFLCCLANRQPEEIGSRDLLQRTVFYAISLGGDTDTIGTMAGAIAGAFCGVESVPQHWLVACEGWNKAEELADGMHRLFVKKSKK